jgi:hypothetical protein
MARPGWRARLVLVYRYVTRMEPTRLRAVWAALVLTLGTLGVVVPTGLDNRVVGFLAALAVLVPLVQGEWTRAKVVPEAKVEARVRAAADQPAGYTDTR